MKILCCSDINRKKEEEGDPLYPGKR